MVRAQNNHCLGFRLQSYLEEAMGCHRPGVLISGVRTYEPENMPFPHLGSIGECSRSQGMHEAFLYLPAQTCFGASVKGTGYYRFSHDSFVL